MGIGYVASMGEILPEYHQLDDDFDEHEVNNDFTSRCPSGRELDQKTSTLNANNAIVFEPCDGSACTLSYCRFFLISITFYIAQRSVR